jgi:hypothetical protein
MFNAVLTFLHIIWGVVLSLILEDEIKNRSIIHTSVKIDSLIIKSVDEAILDLHYNTSLNSIVLEGSGLLGCDAASLGRRFRTFRSDFSAVYSKETQTIWYKHLQAVCSTLVT